MVKIYKKGVEDAERVVEEFNKREDSKKRKEDKMKNDPKDPDLEEIDEETEG